MRCHTLSVLQLGYVRLRRGPGRAGRVVGRSNRNPRSLSNSEFFRDDSVAFRVLLAQVFEQAPALADQHQETAAGVMVLLVSLEVVGETVDPFGEERDLHLGRAGVALVHLELLDQALLLVRGQPHAVILPGAPPPIATSPGPACGSVGTGS